MRVDLALPRLAFRVSLAAVAGLALCAGAARAQYTQFGQNQVQYTKFDWQVIKTEHFDVHY